MGSDVDITPDGTIRVLLVENQRDDCVRASNLLARLYGTKFLMEWAQDFETGQRFLASDDFHVCLFDDRLGDVADFAQNTTSTGTRTPIIVLSSQSDLLIEGRTREKGVAGSLLLSQLTAESLQRSIQQSTDTTRHEVAMRSNAAAGVASLATAIAHLNVGVVITDPRQDDNPIVFVNPAFTEMTGYTPEEVLGRNCRFLAHKDSDTGAINEMREAIRDGHLFKGQLVNRRKDGTRYSIALTISPVFDEQGTLVNFVGLSEDVTARHKIERELRHRRKQHEAMVANIPGMIYHALQRAGGVEFLYVSRGCRELLGVEPEYLQATPNALRAMVHPDDLTSYEAAVVIARQEAKPWQWQGRYLLSSGEEKVLLGKSHPDVQDDGDIIWDGLMMDMTAAVQAEREIAQLAAIVEGSEDAIKGETLDGIITSWNPGAEKLYGYTAAEMIGQTYTKLLLPDRPDETVGLLKRIAKGERVQSYETVRRTKEGTLLDISLTMSPIRDSDGRITGASTLAKDIRARKEADAQIVRQISRIQALRNIDMAITASLDLRVTLNVLLDQVTTHLQVDSAAVLLLDAHTHRLEYAAGRGFRGNAIKNTHLRLGEATAGRAALDRRILSVPYLAESKVDLVRKDLVIEEEFVSYWVVPLITKGRVEGVLEIYHRAYLHADTDWMSFLETLAGQAAIAIENAALFNDLQRSNVELQIAYDSTLEGWSKALDLRDKETEGHTQRVTEATMTLARTLDIPAENVVHMRRGALLHDIGKMGVPDNILLKPGALSDEEWVIMRKHPTYAYELLSPIQYLRPALDIPYCHHEKWDGSGYPRGLKGEQIPLSARIFAVVDVWDALSSDRPYRAAWPAERVRNHIRAGSGSHFDPRIVEAFLDMNL